MTVDQFLPWRDALAGNTPPMHEGEPWCGYFKVRDRRGLNANKTAVKRPWIACAIWPDDDGSLKAERAGTPVPVEALWPWCAKYPISFETYTYWHKNERWPEEIAS